MKKYRKAMLSAAAVGIIAISGRNVAASEILPEDTAAAGSSSEQEEAETLSPSETAALPSESPEETEALQADDTESASAEEVPAAEAEPQGSADESVPEPDTAETAIETLSAAAEDTVLEEVPETADPYESSEIVSLDPEIVENEPYTSGEEDDSAEPVRTDSVIPSGSLTVAESTKDRSGTNWKYDADNNGLTETDNSLVMVDAGLNNLTVQKDLTIVAAGVNRIVSMFLTGSSHVKLAGSGIFMIDSLSCDSAFTGSFGLTEGGSAALFLKNAAGQYVLQNPAAAPGILDESYALAGGTFIIPKNTALDMPVTCQDGNDPVSAASLTVEKGSTLRIQSGAAVTTDYAFNSAKVKDGASEIIVRGTLQLDQGAVLESNGLLYIEDSGTVKGNGTITRTRGNAGFPPAVIYRSDADGSTLNLKNTTVEVAPSGSGREISDPVTLNCSGDCNVMLTADISDLNCSGRTWISVPMQGTEITVRADGIHLRNGCKAELYMDDRPNLRTNKMILSELTGNGSFLLGSGLLRISGTVSVSELTLNGVLISSGTIRTASDKIRTLTGNELVRTSAPAAVPDCAFIAETLRSEFHEFVFHDGADVHKIELSKEAAPPCRKPVVFSEPVQTFETILSHLGFTEADSFTSIRVVYRNNGRIKMCYLTDISETGIKTSDIISVVLLDEERLFSPYPAGTSVSTNTAYSGSGILGSGGFISTNGASINLLVHSGSGGKENRPSETRNAASVSLGYYTADMEQSGDSGRTFALSPARIRQLLTQNYLGILLRSDIGDLRIEAADLVRLLDLAGSDEDLRFVIRVREEETEEGRVLVYTLEIYSAETLLEIPEGMKFTLSLPCTPAENEDPEAVRVSCVYSDGETGLLSASFDEAEGRAVFETEKTGDFFFPGSPS